MSIIYYCLYIYLLLKPFYIFRSGSIQPADFFLIIAFIFLLTIKDKRLKINEIVEKNYKFLLFTICTFAINLIYYTIYLNSKFILSSLYFLFNFFAIILFSLVFDDEGSTKNIGKIMKINIIIQLVIYICHLGKWYGASRYMGTFNDPNQFGYFILMSYMFIYLISIKCKEKKGNTLFLFIVIFLILKCASTGMLVGIIIFLILQFIDILRNFVTFLKKNMVKIIGLLIFAVPILVIFLLINEQYNFVKTDKLLIISRMNEKINRVDSTNKTSDISLIKERGYDRFVYYPQYILYGSGEGEYNRFTKTYHQDEIHATFPSILFYYGLIPTVILLSWVYQKIRKANTSVLIPFIAIFIESFTLLNQRQVMFWLIILFISFINIPFNSEIHN